MKKGLMTLFFFGSVCLSYASNVLITSVSTVTTASTTQVEFNLSWSNSWRTSAGTQNWDAVWIFIKYRDNGIWKHLDLTDLNNVIPSGFSVTVPADKKGAFIYRSTDGSGSVSLVDLRLGVVPVAGNFNLQVFGIEMVYIPAGQFYIGDGASTGSFNVSNSPAIVGAAILNNVKGNSAGDDNQLKLLGIGIDGDGGIDRNNDGVLDNLNFPTGHQPFYTMKYELSRRGYCDFLNTLSYNQQTACTNVAPNSAAGTQVLPNTAIEISTPGVNNTQAAVYGLDGDNDNIFNETTDGEWKAVELGQWKYVCSYLDWAALRPMTEFEFEKICRGPNLPVANEFAWGTTSVFSTLYTITSPSRNNEAASNASSTIGNAYYTATAGAETALRNGVFTTSTSSRIRAGASFNGVMEMSGNISEAIVTVGNNAGRSYSGKLGNGFLNSSGYADVDYWPGVNGNANASLENNKYEGVTGVTQSAGAGSRGIGFISANGSEMKVSDRSSATVSNTVKYGGRGVRQEPYTLQPVFTGFSMDEEFQAGVAACIKLCSDSAPANARIELIGDNPGHVKNMLFGASDCSSAGAEVGCSAGEPSNVINNLKPNKAIGVRLFEGTSIRSSYVFISGGPGNELDCSNKFNSCTSLQRISWNTTPCYQNTDAVGSMNGPLLAINRNGDAFTFAWLFVRDIVGGVITNGSVFYKIQYDTDINFTAPLEVAFGGINPVTSSTNPIVGPFVETITGLSPIVYFRVLFSTDGGVTYMYGVKSCVNCIFPTVGDPRCADLGEVVP